MGMMGALGAGMARMWGAVTSGRDMPLSRAYQSASPSAQEMATWWPSLGSADSAITPARDISLARARDLARNDAHAKSGIDRRVDLLVGAGIRLVAAPDAESLGLDRDEDRDEIRDLRRQIEREWRLFALDPHRWSDAERKVSLNGRFRQLARTWAVNDEVVAVLRWRDDPRARYRTCLQAIDPDRLCNPFGQSDTLQMRGGLELDPLGAVVAGHIRNGHLADPYAASVSSTWERVPRETPWGRPVLIHGFEPEREGQTRAITPFAAIVQRLRMLGKHADTELANAVANSLVVATLASNLPVGEANASLNIVSETYANHRLDWYSKHHPSIGGVRIPVLPIGDELKFNNAGRPTAAFGAFQTAFLRSIAAALGLSYEQLSMDWSQTNYSSARAALNEVWRGVRRDFAAFVEQVVMPVYLAFLEEAFDRRYIVAPSKCPSFWDLPAAWASSRWIGAPRGYVDPVKEAQGSALRLDNLTSTLEAECAEQGLDVEDVLDQAQFEAEELRLRGLVRTGGAIKPADDGPEEQNPSERSRES